MYARTTTVQGRSDALDAGIDMVRDQVMPTVLAMDGCRGLSMLVDRDSGHVIVTTSWESQEAMRATAESVTPMRERASRLLGGDAVVQEWEVVVMHRAHQTPQGCCVRSVWLRVDPETTERVADVFRLGVLPRAEQLDGFCSAMLMVDRTTGLAVSSVAFDDARTIAASRDAARGIRENAAREIGADVLDVREHDLVLAHLHVPELA